MPIYRYYCLGRSPMRGNVPDGYIRFKVWGSRPYIEEARCVVLGTVDYCRLLSIYEMQAYSLSPANCVQQPIEYTA